MSATAPSTPDQFNADKVTSFANSAQKIRLQSDTPNQVSNSAGLNVLDQSGVIANFDPLQSATSLSFSVTGDAGSGKTAFIYDLIGYAARHSCEVYVLDGGGSYLGAALWVDGSYRAPSLHQPVSFNPLWGMGTDESGTQPVEYHLELVADLVMHLFELNSREIGDQSWYRRFIVVAIQTIWKTKRDQMELRDLYDFCIQTFEISGDRRAVTLATAIAPYAVDAYSAWFNGRPTEIDANFSQFVDVENLHCCPKLLCALTPMVIYSFIRSMSAHSLLTRKLLILDDAHTIFSGLHNPSLMRKFLKVLAEENVSVGIVADRFEHYQLSVGLQLVFEETPWKFVFHLSEDSIDFARREKLLVVSDQQRWQLAEIGPRSNFTEMAIVQHGMFGLFSHFADPHAHKALLPRGAAPSHV